MTPLERLLDWFTPAHLAAERETRQRARMFLISHFFGPVIGSTIPAFLVVVNGQGGFPIWVLWGAILAFWLYPPVLRLTGRYNSLALLSVQNLLFCILWGCYFYGGVSSPFVAWLLTVPLLAFFYLGSATWARFAVVGLIVANMAGFYSLFLSGHQFPSSTPLSALQGIGIVSILAAAVYTSMMALYYAKILASQVELEGEMRGHLVTAAELRRATAEAERAGAAKAEFLAKMSHELRTPLNAVIGYSQILLEDAEAEGDAGASADLEKIHGAGQHLLRLVNEVLDLSKIEAGKMDLAFEEFDVAGFVSECVDAYRGAAEANGNSVSVQIGHSVGTIVADRKKAGQALGQILDNAAKFTRGGRITVSAERRAGRPGDEVVVRVRDTGVGIAREALAGLFEKFTVADDASATKYGGTGLGLALSLKLCRLMGGDVTVESALGVGSCFTLTLPASPPAPQIVADEDAGDDEDVELSAA